MKFVFTDGEKLGVYENGEKILLESAYIKRYKENALSSQKNKEWKKKTDTMLNDGFYEGTNESVVAQLKGVALSETVDTLVYAFTVNDSSGIYTKCYTDKEKTEAHIITSNDVDFNCVTTCIGGEMLGAVQENPVNAHVALFSPSGDYKSLTGGDCLDENPAFDRNGNVLYNSYGVGRDEMNNFVKYFPSEIYRLNLHSLDIQTLAADEKFSFIKPMSDASGNVYCIRKPASEKDSNNPLLDILLIPVRIVQGIVGFISSFVMCFSGKPLVKGKSMQAMGDGGAAKNGDRNPAKLFINQNLINVEKELKKNKKTEDYGFIPHSWKLVKLGENGETQELASGVADFCIVQEDGKDVFIYTNGKHVFALKDGKKQKLLDTDFCLKVGGILTKNTSDNLFDSL